MWDKITAKLGAANESLSLASKQWRDESLSSREKEVLRRERDATSSKDFAERKLAEARRLEAKLARRKWVHGLWAIGGAVLGFIFGVAFGSSGGAPLGSIQSQSPPSQVEAEQLEASQVATPVRSARDYGSGNDFDAGRYCIEVAKVSEDQLADCLVAASLASETQKR